MVCLQKQFANERIAALLEDRRIRQQDEEVHHAMHAQKVEELMQRLQKTEMTLQQTTKDYIIGMGCGFLWHCLGNLIAVPWGDWAKGTEIWVDFINPCVLFALLLLLVSGFSGSDWSVHLGLIVKCKFKVANRCLSCKILHLILSMGLVQYLAWIPDLHRCLLLAVWHVAQFLVELSELLILWWARSV